MGAFAYTVVRLQKGLPTYPMYESEYLHSFIENAGDIFKLAKHTGTVGRCEQTVTEASKYLYREIKSLNDGQTMSSLDKLVGILNQVKDTRGQGQVDNQKQVHELTGSIHKLSKLQDHKHNDCDWGEVVADLEAVFKNQLI